MEKQINNILKIATKLDVSNQSDIASKIDKISENLMNVKTAQYLGVQGMSIRNGRCLQNCYRQKRVTQKNKPVQEIWNDCHNEYLESLSGKNPEFDKYAGNDEIAKFTKFAELEEYVKSNVDELFEIAKNIEDKDTAIKVAKICDEIIKEAQGQGFGQQGFLGRVWEGAKDLVGGQNAATANRAARLIAAIDQAFQSANPVVQSKYLLPNIKQEINELSLLARKNQNNPSYSIIAQTVIALTNSYNHIEELLRNPSPDINAVKTALKEMSLDLSRVQVGQVAEGPSKAPVDFSKAIMQFIEALKNELDPKEANYIEKIWNDIKANTALTPEQASQEFKNSYAVIDAYKKLDAKRKQKAGHKNIDYKKSFQDLITKLMPLNRNLASSIATRANFEINNPNGNLEELYKEIYNSPEVQEEIKKPGQKIYNGKEIIDYFKTGPGSIFKNPKEVLTELHKLNKDFYTELVTKYPKYTKSIAGLNQILPVIAFRYN